MSLTQAERITKVKIRLYKEQPFFSYIVNHMAIIEKKEVGTMAVNSRGDLFYNPEFVDKLNDDELMGVVSHEALHCSLLHLKRLGGKDMKLWNYATDLAANTMLIQNNFKLPQGCVIPDYNNEFKLTDKKKIEFVDKKMAEMLYNEMYEEADKIIIKDNPYGDGHIYDPEGNGSGNGKKDGKDDGKENGGSNGNDNGIDWKQVITEAAYFARQKGNMSAGMERIVDRIINSKLSWKQLLYRYITNELPNDYTFARPSRRAQATGLYLPSLAKESIKIMAAIDTSGSIGEKELGLFLGELYRITKSFSNMELEVVFHDSEIAAKHTFKNGTLHKVLELKAAGGGGTSHKEVFEYANKTRPNILVCFTDGYSDIDECKKFSNTLFLLIADEYKPKFGKPIYFDRSDM